MSATASAWTRISAAVRGSLEHQLPVASSVVSIRSTASWRVPTEAGGSTCSISPALAEVQLLGACTRHADDGIAGLAEAFHEGAAEAFAGADDHEFHAMSFAVKCPLRRESRG